MRGEAMMQGIGRGEEPKNALNASRRASEASKDGETTPVGTGGMARSGVTTEASGLFLSRNSRTKVS